MIAPCVGGGIVGLLSIALIVALVIYAPDLGDGNVERVKE
jgi:hypothetical protein